jgi:hypothetical protein
MPKIIYVDTSTIPKSQTVVAESAEEFAAAIIQSAKTVEDG